MKAEMCLAVSALAATAVALLSGCSAEPSAAVAQPGAEHTVIVAQAELPEGAPRVAKSERVARGEYLVKVTACNDCHTPFTKGPNGPAPDMTRMLSGHPADVQLPAPPAIAEPWVMAANSTNTAFYGPWGISYAINLTPDPTGIGSWSEEMFVKALKTGRHLGDGRMILPPMPWQSFAQMSDDDLKSIYAYLKTLPPVSNKVPAYLPSSQLNPQ
jgi:cytochrome c553